MPSLTMQRRLAWILIGIGVLAWVPYFYRLSAGETPSILPYLAVHLAGVLSGAWLRSRSTSATQKAHGRRRKVVANVMVLLGVLAWAPYFYLNEIAMQPQPLAPFLTAHLIGVLGGSALRVSVMIEGYLKRDEDSEPG